MKQLYAILEKYSFVLILLFLLIVIFRPLILHGQIPFSSNLLVSFFNPWAQEKFPGWSQGIPNKPVGIDDLRIFYPQRHFTIQEYQKGILPLWNPYSFSGNYHAGLSETAVFYPLSFLFLFLPQLPTWILLLILEPIVITTGSYFFLRLLKLSKPASIFGGIVFGFSGLVIVRMVEGLSVGHTLMWTPVVLYGIEGFFQKKKLRYVLITLIAMSCSLFAGWFQFAFYTIFLGGVYAVYRFILESNKKQNLLVFLAFVSLPFVTLFHIIPALEAFSLSSRGATTTQELLQLHLMPWSHLLTYFYPDFFGNPGSYNFFGKSEYKESIVYIGVIPFVISLFGIFRRNRYALFFSVISIFGIFLGIDNPVTRSILRFPIPIISSFLPNRVFYFATVGLSVLSAYGLEIILEKKLQKLRAFFVTLITLVLVGIANGFVFFATVPKLSQLPFVKIFAFLGGLRLISQAYQIDIAKHNVYVSDAIIGIFIIIFLIGRLFPKKILLIGIFILTIIGQIYFAQKYIPFSQSQFVFPPNGVFTYLQNNAGRDRFISTGNGYITTNSPLFYNLYTPDGVGSMYIERYGQLVTYMQTKGKDYTHIPRVEIRIDPSADEMLSGKNNYLLRFMQIDGVKYVVRLKSDPTTVNTKLFSKVWEDKVWEIYIFNNTSPRIFWTSEFATEKTNNALLEKLFETTGNEIVLEQSPGFPSYRGSGSITLEQYTPDKIAVSINTTQNGLVYISDNYVPQWKAYVDGKQTTLFRANYTFMAVPVGKGHHEIILKYIDTKEIIAFVVSAIGLVGIAAGLIVAKKKKFL